MPGNGGFHTVNFEQFGQNESGRMKFRRAYAWVGQRMLGDVLNESEVLVEVGVAGILSKVGDGSRYLSGEFVAAVIVVEGSNLLGNDALMQFVVSDGDEPDFNRLWLGKVEDSDSFSTVQNSSAEPHHCIALPFEVLGLVLAD